MTISAYDLKDATQQVRQMDLHALGVLFDHYYPQIYRYVCFRLGESDATNELIDLVFQEIIVGLQKQRLPEDDLSPWIFKTAARLVDGRQRSHQGQKNASPGFPSTSSAESDHDEFSWLGKLTRKCLDQLPPLQQHLVALRFSQSLSLEEIAQITGKTINELRLMQTEALTSLRLYLEEEA
jgi:RNA polymerase sigma-70 factor, ECF subfamily